MKEAQSQYYADHDAPYNMLSVKREYFPQLTSQEQKYAHFMSKASHAGTRIVLRQVSYESEPIFDLIMRVNANLNGKEYSDLQLEENEAEYYLDYVSQFLSNLGNYKSFGDSKFIPRCSEESFYKIVEAANIDLNGPVENSPFNNVKELIEKGIYYIDEDIALLGFPSDGHMSSYYLGDPITLQDMNVLKEELFAKYSILPENTRINKVKDNLFEVWIASQLLENTVSDSYPDEKIALSNGAIVKFKFGDHSREMGLIVSFLREAKEYAANETQANMVEEYIKCFKTGSSHAHKEAQKLWVKDISPTVETNIGFIETYREPSGIIGEFESLVSIQNKQRTAKFATMVENAEEFISLLPWDKDYEKSKFNPPDFTSLEVLTFTGSGIPAGINIPNYDDVRLTIGFKNVSLGNILSAAAKASSKYPPSFIKDSDRAIFDKYQSKSFEVQVGIHELLGHGSGKLLMETAPNEFNFDINNPPLDLQGKPVKTCYKLGETWGSVFGSLAGAFEETRAEVVAMYLITNRKLLDIFGFKTKEEQDNVIYAGYLQMARAGLMALEFWDPKTQKWGQPHMQARYSIMKTFLLHCSAENFLNIEYDAENNDLKISMDRSLIETAGHGAVKDYLTHLHVFKCSADYARGSEYYINRSTVTPELAKFRDIVIAKRLPRRQFIQANTRLLDDEVQLNEYEETALGMIQSFVEREL
ncbi:hypothetical protein KAFR_0C00980 [Kazachstania africana CBS 2517]|uniref:Dipeptidyl peptidase 3 n=1 Tax=Kazachstania africana (strain ATCC 22294 / BCRC 22015 / CBS 2517 / CECT 1963 / NBRC 1671 / NRRL Y-8276) TaxID=1071382 RepID=H2ARU3_KAZAF|nr:hypothetical protein KAFR_0C00980 [Kazachstania africana CBS 2517]CCF57093.1 hypothetical protein KAFR_0C00980 [Kazachstania africana CBS 2517]